jgi:hypothetical protein
VNKAEKYIINKYSNDRMKGRKVKAKRNCRRRAKALVNELAFAHFANSGRLNASIRHEPPIWPAAGPSKEEE